MDEWISIAKLAKNMNVHRSTVYRWVKDGKILKRHIKEFPNGQVAIRVNSIMKPPRRKKYTRVNDNIAS